MANLSLRALFVGTMLLEMVLGIAPPSGRTTWALENFPIWIGVALYLVTRRKFPLSRLCLTLLCLHAVVLMVGGYYTYAKVPLGFWVENAFGLARNHYDRLGHFTQGFVPAILTREILLRVAGLPRNGWLPFLTVCVCLAFSASYELFEWWTAVVGGSAADDFLGTQGDVWDTQWDMFLAVVGATTAMLTLTGVHDRSMAKLPLVRSQNSSPAGVPS